MPVVSIANLTKTYASGFRALERVDLDIRKGEIFALLGPNGAGKTTLINIVCGIVTPSSGTVRVDGRDIQRDYRVTRSMCAGSEARPKRPRLKVVVRHGVSNMSVCSSWGTRPMSERAAR